MCKLRINTSCSVPLSLRVLKHPDSTQEASRKPPSFILFTSQGIVTPALPFANEPALSDHLYQSAITPWTSPIDIPIPPVLYMKKSVTDGSASEALQTHVQHRNTMYSTWRCTQDYVLYIAQPHRSYLYIR